eukprot:CAMPEP_0116545468 /NCGR_PEP_ID=MMETSP0397-20121206/2686_1 /TAXON_ID=216820 /ORGANISM="Cyclophora tenuis, Strain ECT3854" /LENGTH=243 /DNA_ID=CAMNT_0004069787 /DNA_START=21 /DNA_END=752 /DNA_ORIENTATION=+
MLLCPYATLSALINHNQTLVNVRLQWADPERSNQASWFDLTVGQINKKKSAGLAMELVATRDIQEGEEIFLDYGNDWENAWNKHVEEWEPVEGAESYRSGDQLRIQEVKLKTVFEQMESPYPSNVRLLVDEAVVGSNQWKVAWKRGKLDAFFKKQDKYRYPCDILRREEEDDGTIWYTGIALYEENQDDGTVKWNPRWFTRAPREAFFFQDQPYTTDMHLPNAFRYPIGIPDELLPEMWKNSP